MTTFGLEKMTMADLQKLHTFMTGAPLVGMKVSKSELVDSNVAALKAMKAKADELDAMKAPVFFNLSSEAGHESDEGGESETGGDAKSVVVVAESGDDAASGGEEGDIYIDFITASSITNEGKFACFSVLVEESTTWQDLRMEAFAWCHENANWVYEDDTLSMVPLNILQDTKKVGVVTAALNARFVVDMLQELGSFKIQMPLNLKMRGGGQSKRSRGYAEGGDGGGEEPKKAYGAISEFLGDMNMKAEDSQAAKNIISHKWDVTAMLYQCGVGDVEAIRDIAIAAGGKQGHSDLVIKSYAKHISMFTALEATAPPSYGT